MKLGCFSVLLFCTALLLSGCDARETQETVESLPPKPAAFTRKSKIEDVKHDPVFGSYGRLLFPVENAYYSGDTLEELQLTYYSHIDPDETVEIVNTLRERAADGQTIFYDIYTDEEKAADPAKEDTGLFFFKGIPGEKFAICNAGGAFAYVGAMQDSFPHALELSKKGYNAFALIYRPGAQTACEDLARAIRLRCTLCGRQADIFTQCQIGNPVKFGVDALQNSEEQHFLGFIKFIERAFCYSHSLRQLIHGGFLHPQRDGTASRFLQQCLAELLSLVIGKSQGCASSNMTVLVLLVILYRVSFWFARGAGKNMLILTEKLFSLNAMFQEGAPLPSAKSCTPSKPKLLPHIIVSIKITVLCHKSTVILIELRWTFSLPKNRLKSRFSPFQSINDPRHRAILRRGFVRFRRIVAFCAVVIVKQLSNR